MGLEHTSPGSRQPSRVDAQRTTQIPASQAQPRRRNELPKLRASYFQVSLAAVAALFVLASVGFAALGRETHPEGTIPPGVFIAGAHIGEMPDDEARDKLRTHLSEYADNPVSLVWEDEEWNPTMDELGARFDLDATLADADFTRSRIDRVQSRLFGVERTDIPLRLRLDENKLAEYVSGVAAEIDRPPEVPSLEMGDDGLALASAANGLETDQQRLTDQIRESIYALDEGSIQITVNETEPEFDDVDVDAVKSMIDESLGGPLTLWFEDQSWEISPDQLYEFLRLQQDEGDDVQLGFREEEFVAFLDQLVGEIDRPARNAEIAWGGESVVATSPSQNGIQRDLEGTIQKLEEAIANGQREVELAYDVIEPEIDSENLGELGIDGLMAQGESAFWNSAASRANNISVAAGYLDGTVVPPGSEFSFNQAIGEISVERGYQEGYVIQAEETVPGIGGGVCQVSTTMFRAAFFSGLPITERNPHAYLVGFYEEGGWPVGFDAAIFQPNLDLKFQNTSDSYLLIHTAVVDQMLYVNIYGPDLGYNVELGEPNIQSRTAPPEDVEVLDESMAPGERRQVEFAKPGMEVTLPRTVTDSNGEIVRQDSFYSNFQAWGNRFLVGPSPETDAQDPEDAPEPGEPSGEIIEEEVNEDVTTEQDEDPPADESGQNEEPQGEGNPEQNSQNQQEPEN